MATRTARWSVNSCQGSISANTVVQVSFASRTNKYEPIYRLKVRYTDPKDSVAFDWKEMEISAPFTRWFTADGYFEETQFREWLGSSVPLLQTK